MNLRLTSLLCGLLLIAAAPVLADRMPDSGYTNDSAYAEIHAGVTNEHGLRLNEPLNVGFRAAPTAAVLINGFEATHAADARDSKSSLALDAIFPSSSNADAHSVNLSDFGSFERAYSILNSGEAWGKEGDGSGNNGWSYKKSEAPTTVPEPGSILLLLVGLAGIGVIAHRRGQMQKAISTVRGLQKESYCSN